MDRLPGPPGGKAPGCPRARALDERAIRLLRGEGALELALGETLLRLFDGDRLMRLGFARAVDYAREFPGATWRSVREWLRLARGLATRPLLRRAVVAGLVTPRKARLVFPVAKDAAEGAWTYRAAHLGEEDLARAMRAEGHAPGAEGAAFESLLVELTDGQRERLERGLAMAERAVGHGQPGWRRFEAMAQEYVSSHGAALATWDEALERTREEEAAGSAVAPVPVDEQRLAELVERELAALGEAGALLAGPPGGRLPTDALELHRLAARLHRARQQRDLALGVVLTEILDGKAWEELGYPSRERYCRERLQVCSRTVREKVFLERRMRALPSLRAALEEGRINGAQARLIARQASVFDVDHRIEQAAGTTVQQMREQSDAEEERKNRVAGIERVWGPDDAMPVILDALACAQLLAAKDGERIGAGEALARVADHFHSVWRRQKLPRLSRRRRDIVERQQGRCAVPGCSAPVQHIHHIRPRSRGGGDEPDNLLGLCAFHHLRGVHGQLLTVTGAAGRLLCWRFRGTGQEWMTLDGWRVRRVMSRRPRPHRTEIDAPAARP